MAGDFKWLLALFGGGGGFPPYHAADHGLPMVNEKSMRGSRAASAFADAELHARPELRALARRPNEPDTPFHFRWLAF
jgi:hypothetical protein